MERFKVKLQVNGESEELDVKPSETLLETLRDRMELTGTKEGCGLGACGSCTVLLNGLPTRSCIVLTAELDGSEVCCRIKACGELASTYAITLTPKGEEAYCQTGLAAGVVYYMTKPCSSIRAVHRVNTALNRQRTGR